MSFSSKQGAVQHPVEKLQPRQDNLGHLSLIVHHIYSLLLCGNKNYMSCNAQRLLEDNCHPDWAVIWLPACSLFEDLFLSSSWRPKQERWYWVLESCSSWTVCVYLEKNVWHYLALVVIVMHRPDRAINLLQEQDEVFWGSDCPTLTDICSMKGSLSML